MASKKRRKKSSKTSWPFGKKAPRRKGALRRGRITSAGNRKSLMPESVIRMHAIRLKKNARAAKIYRKVLKCG